MTTAFEKIKLVAEIIYNDSQIAGDSAALSLVSSDARLDGLAISELENIFNALEDESKIFSYKIAEEKVVDNKNIRKYEFNIDELIFRDFLIEKYRSELSIQDQVEEVVDLQKKYLDDQQKELDKKVVYWLEFYDWKHILINGKYRLSGVVTGKSAYKVFDYAFRHAGKLCPKDEIDSDFGEHDVAIRRSLSDIVTNDLGFKNEIRKAFVKTSSKTVMIRKEVTLAELKEIGVDQKKLDEEITSLEVFEK